MTTYDNNDAKLEEVKREEEITIERPEDGLVYTPDDQDNTSGRGLANFTQNLVDPEKTLTGLPGERGSPHIYISFDENDPRDPMHFSYRKKWTITTLACMFTVLAAANGATYALGFPSMERDLNCTPFEAAIGLATYCLGFGVVPLFSASFSEEFGRKPLYVVSITGFALMHLMSALSQNVSTIIVARLLAGAFGSTGSTMVGGTIADIFAPHERGLPMSIFSLSALGATGLGAMAAGWIEQNPHLQWRWISWISLIISGALVVLIPLLMGETRASVLLLRLAKKMRKETGDNRYRARVEDELPNLRALIMVSATRPLYLIFTEPTVASFSLWVGFAWGVLYALIESIGPVFTHLYNFNSGQVGSIFVTLFVGSILGYFTNMYQETLYKKRVATRGPEARLYAVCFTAWLFPIGMFIFAWTAFPFVHWIAPTIGIVIFMWGLFSVYCAGFTYLADVYGPYASSAIAGQSLSRNVMGLAFPLFTQQMLDKLGYNWSNTIFAILAVVMAPVPAVLFFFGPQIRARSKFAVSHVHKNT